MGKGKSVRKFVMFEEYELNTPAYESLSGDAIALLIEFRRRFNGKVNRITMSIREIRARLRNAGQSRAYRARDELVDRGWIRMIQNGSHHSRYAAVYALENHPLHDRDGEVAPKGYMKWKPPRKTDVLKTGTACTQDEYSGAQNEA